MIDTPTLPISEQELRQHLAPLAPRGQGQFRQSGLTVKKLSQNQFQVGHPTLGSYLLVLDDLQKLSETGPGYASLEEDPWEITWPAKFGELIQIHLFRNMLLRASANYTASAIRLIKSETAYPPGACKVCGSTKVRLRIPLVFDVEMTGLNQAQWDGQGGLQNVLVSAHCLGCQTEHPIATMQDNFVGTINQCAFTKRGKPETQPESARRMTLKNLLAGE